ncbi:hypothetical protein TNCV_2894361 [Trichonephila clavipes]|nr:hypothetical protein TNCV_2894361 [Trichonephila clavipes]
MNCVKTESKALGSGGKNTIQLVQLRIVIVETCSNKTARISFDISVYKKESLGLYSKSIYTQFTSMVLQSATRIYRALILGIFEKENQIDSSASNAVRNVYFHRKSETCSRPSIITRTTPNSSQMSCTHQNYYLPNSTDNTT